MKQSISSVKDIKAGHMYIGEYYTNYMVCLGKYIADQEDVFLFAIFGERATGLENKSVANFVNKDVMIHRYKMTDYKIRHICKVVEAAEYDIMKWLTQLKLTGFNIMNGVDNECYIGDWHKRKKLECVKEFEVGERYVEEPLAYIRQRTPYQEYDVVWRYSGKSNGMYIWYASGILGGYKKRYEVVKKFTSMVKYNPNIENYQI
jgi:hypothetical protein